MDNTVDNPPNLENDAVDSNQHKKMMLDALIKKHRWLTSKIMGCVGFYFETLGRLGKKTRALIFVGAAFAILLFIVFTASVLQANHQPSHQIHPTDKNNGQLMQTPAPNLLHDQLNDLSLKLANIEQTLSKGQADTHLNQVKSAISSLQSDMNQLASHRDYLIQQQIQSSASRVQGQLISIQKALTAISFAKKQHQMLSPSHLPFTVVSIDNIQQSDVVTIRYDHRLLPVDVGDSLAGWTLVSASNVNQKAQFRNAQNDFVAINLNTWNQTNQGGE